MAPRIVTDPTVPLGRFGVNLFASNGSGWLLCDGVTEYPIATYPDFIAQMDREYPKGCSLITKTASNTRFKVNLVPEGSAIVAAGANTPAGSIFGSGKAALTMENIPAHSHGYVDTIPDVQTGKGGLLTGLLTVLSGVGSKNTDKTTKTAGSADPTPVAIVPLSVAGRIFIYAGRPRAS